ncbi:3543_t:CDS:2 [Cetraspora pellucida]|uniref:3543_t:CDS:1 n=1 Tax=Cetraspora pellucida TaxID=1433469 RepID=A0A9N8Z1P0_9GLOM|nr:3543_t:CDS:2 [Cetraspora pellucida]
MASLDSQQDQQKIINSIAEALKKLQESDVKKFDYSSFQDVQPIGSGASSDVFSTTFEQKPYALKKMTRNHNLDNEILKIATRKIVDELIRISEMPIESEFIYNKIAENKPAPNSANLIADGQPTLLYAPSLIDTPLSSITNLSVPSNKSSINLLDEIWLIFLNLTNIGNEFSQIHKAIEESIEKHQRLPKDVFNNLKSLPNYPNAQCLLGFFYFAGIGTEKQFNTAFEAFQKVADQDNALGQFYLGECFRCGFGTKKDPKSAIEWHEKASDKCARSTNALGTKKNLDLAKDWYKKAGDNGHEDAKKQYDQLNNKGISFTMFKAKGNNHIQSNDNKN